MKKLKLDERKRKIHFVGYLIFLVLLAFCYFVMPEEHFFTSMWIWIGLLTVFNIYLIFMPSNDK